MPIILVHEPFWRGLLDWCASRLVEEGMIDATDIDLVQVCNEPQAGGRRDLRLLREARLRAFARPSAR